MDELVKFAYSMRKKIYGKGTVIMNQGDRVDSVAIIKKGVVKIIHKMITQRKSKIMPIEKISFIPNPDDVAIEIAEIGPHDLIGAVEAITNAKKMRNEVIAQTQVEVFFIQSNIFSSFLQQEQKTSTYIDKLGEEHFHVF